MAGASNRFTGKVVLVTGASSGIGRATALAFAREGASVVIASRGTERGTAVLDELKALDHDAVFVPADMSQAHDVERLVAAGIGSFGRLDVAVNNAATIEVGTFKLTAGFDDREFDQHMASGRPGNLPGESPARSHRQARRGGRCRSLAVFGSSQLRHRPLTHRRRRSDRRLPVTDITVLPLSVRPRYAVGP